MTTPKLLLPKAVAILLSLHTIGCAQVGQASPERTQRRNPPEQASAAPGIAAAPDGWLSWRGPEQNGCSRETGLPAKVDEKGKGSWTFKLAGRGTPVIANGRVYALGYEGTQADLEEIVVCLEESTGKKIWDHRFTDLPTDVIYYRYAIGSPTIDPETGNVLCMSTGGLLTCLSNSGKLIWQHSMMSEYGRLTFPNGRTGAPLVDGDLCIVHVVTSGWGADGPARDRFYAFDKKTGVNVWSSTPGGPPKDSSFSFPVVADENGQRVLYAGLGGGHVVCVDVRTGDPLSRFLLATGGLSSSVVLYKNSVIAMNGKENVDASTIGRMVAIKRGARPEPGKGPVELGKDSELWRNHCNAFTSSPVVVGNLIYQTVLTGDLYCVDADNGKPLWHEKLAPDQIHASPAWGDGKLYVPMNNGSFYILEVSAKGPKILQHLQLAGNCLGAPAIAGGRIYVHTTEKLYSFAGGTGESPPPKAVMQRPALGKAVRLQIIPADFVTVPGQVIPFQVRSLDHNGLVVSDSVRGAAWSNLPAKGASMSESDVLTLAKDAAPTANVMTVTANGMQGTVRLRVVPNIPFSDDFENAVLKPHPREPGVNFSFPRPYWVGAGLKWEIRELEDDKVLAKTLDMPLFQRTISMIGHPDMSNYTMQVDIRSDGNRRSMSSGGVVNQRYQIVLKGNYQELEVSSNMELLKQSVKFRWKRDVWYRMKTRVDLNKDGSGVVRAKVWQRDQEEPADWTIEVPHSHAHQKGSPGLYGFVPQSRFRVYLDNISVTSND